jgi:hypothetical protein
MLLSATQISINTAKNEKVSRAAYYTIRSRHQQMYVNTSQTCMLLSATQISINTAKNEKVSIATYYTIRSRHQQRYVNTSQTPPEALPPT